MATIHDVAKIAGVSIATVSRVVNKYPNVSQPTFDLVTQVMNQLGYRPNPAARALVNQTSNTIGVLVGDVSEPFFGTLVKAVDMVLHQHDKHMLVGNGYHDADYERKAIELLINNRCEALIVHSKGLTEAELIEYAKEVKGMVIINRHIPEIAERCISLDNKKGAYLATEYLIKQGHEKIACIASADEIEDSKERVEGYLAALKDNNIVLSERYITYQEPRFVGGEAAMIDLLTKSIDMTAVVAYNDYMAAGALAVAQENGIVAPNQLSVIGFDDGLIARYISPRLTTIRYPIELMAQKAATLALELAKGESISAESFCFSPTLVRRDSVMKR